MKSNIDNFIVALVANKHGEIFELDGYASVGMSGNFFKPIQFIETQKIPYGTELMLLPDRVPVLFNLKKNEFEALAKNPYKKDESIFPVAAFNSPGYVISYVSAYKELPNTVVQLPLFSYGAVGWHKGDFRSAIIKVDIEKRQDLRFMKQDAINIGVLQMEKKLPKNRLRVHLEKCALVYGCPAAKNFFLKRFEAPLPTSQSCNAKCIGCISLQDKGKVSNCQERISFTPNPSEIAEIAVEHIKNVKNAIVSFGQGCEGDPLMAAFVIEPAIKIIRSQTLNGTINLNTNASCPDIVEKLFKAGLNSIRISINSFQEKFYNAYFRPKGYTLLDVMESINTANKYKKFISINYLNIPGFTDTIEEFKALKEFLNNYPINMIQWRNLNVDPVMYYKIVERTNYSPFGMNKLLSEIKIMFPKIKFGYFNPSY